MDDKLPDGVIACTRPGAPPLTAYEREAIRDFASFLRECKAIKEQYEGAERDAKIAELAARYEADHDARQITPTIENEA